VCGHNRLTYTCESRYMAASTAPRHDGTPLFNYVVIAMLATSPCHAWVACIICYGESSRPARGSCWGTGSWFIIIIL
jgi:hypothetical protein